MRTREGDKENDIIKAAIVLFGEDGYKDAKMHHIADKAKVGIGTVYLYFNNKEKILYRIFEAIWNDLLAIVSSIKNDGTCDPLQKMDRLIDAVFDYFAKNPKLSRILINQQHYMTSTKKVPPFQAAYAKTLVTSEAIITEGQEKGLFNPSISAHFFQFFFFGGIRNSLMQWVDESRNIPVAELRSNVKTVLLAGMTTF